MSELLIPGVMERIRPLDAGAMRAARHRQRSLTKPPGSLGRLEALSVQLAGIFAGAIPLPMQKTVIVAAGDHGVVAQGVTEYPQDVTAQMVLNFLRGGAAINVLARHSGASVLVVDAGVVAELPAHPDLYSLRLGAGTGDIAAGPAMPLEQAQRAVLAGAHLAKAQAE